MDFFSGILLFVGHDPQDGCQNHPRAMYPLQISVKAYGAFGFDPRNFRRKDRIISRRVIQSSGQAARATWKSKFAVVAR